ncbi:MAG: hypothetical protein ACT6U0_13405 [Shinella sp.]
MAGKAMAFDGSGIDHGCLPIEANVQQNGIAVNVAIVPPSGIGNGRIQTHRARAPPRDFA